MDPIILASLAPAQTTHAMPSAASYEPAGQTQSRSLIVDPGAA